MKKLFKIDRLAAWVLYIGMFVYFISGLGMVYGIIDKGLASKIHLGILNNIMIIAFLTHTSFAIHLALKRWKLWNIFTKSLLVIIVLISLIGFFKITNVKKIETIDQNTTVVGEKVFTKDELAIYDGKNGQPAYVAVDGIVYDLSNVFQNGFHYSHIAGQDLTNAFYIQHAKSQIAKYPVVGKLAK